MDPLVLLAGLIILVIGAAIVTAAPSESLDAKNNFDKGIVTTIVGLVVITIGVFL